MYSQLTIQDAIAQVQNIQLFRDNLSPRLRALLSHCEIILDGDSLELHPENKAVCRWLINSALTLSRQAFKALPKVQQVKIGKGFNTLMIDRVIDHKY